MRRHPTVLLCFVGLSLLLTWPLALHFATHVPGNGIDDPSLAWNLWWAKHALVDHPQNPFVCSWIFWPVGINLAFYTLTLLNGVLSIPLQSVMGVVPAYNVLLLSSFVLGGYGAYLFCRAVCSGTGAAGPKGTPGLLPGRRVLWLCFGQGILRCAGAGQCGQLAVGAVRGPVYAQSRRQPWAAPRCRPGGHLPDLAGLRGRDLRFLPRDPGCAAAGVAAGAHGAEGPGHRRAGRGAGQEARGVCRRRHGDG